MYIYYNGFLEFLIILAILVIVIYLSVGTAYAESFTDDMKNGVIDRIILLQEANYISFLKHGVYAVTGGAVQVGSAEGISHPKILGIAVHAFSENVGGYTPGNQPFNMNFAKVLYEMRAAGVKYVNQNMLDRDINGRLTQNSYYTDYLAGLRDHLGIPEHRYGRISITNKILNALAEQE